MLENLYVKNLALIDQVEVEFGKNLNVLSGETGAGKSIIIGSVLLALGGKCTKDMIRQGQEYAYVELAFSVEDQEVAAKLNQLGIRPQDGLITISRKLSPTKSICRINGETTSAATVREAASWLIDIHGQHDHQTLLYKSKHLQIVDSYGKEQIADKKHTVAKLYHEYHELQKELETFSLDEETRRRSMDLLEYEIEEITSARLVVGEDEELSAALRRLSHGRLIRTQLYEIQEGISSGAGSSLEIIGKGIRSIQSLMEYDETLGEIYEQLNDAESILSDAARTIGGHLDDMDSEDGELETLQSRLDQIYRLKTKYGQDIPEIFRVLAEKEAELEKLNNYAGRKKELCRQIERIQGDMVECALQLHHQRVKVAKKLSSLLRGAMKELNFLDTNFEIALHEKEIGPTGIDEVEFMVSLNPGEPLKPLTNIASGGELSRIMLAVKSVLADSDSIMSLIFDEIDTGISGRTAQRVGEKLNQIAKKHQVICISHLPQIVAMADRHFLIEKEVSSDKTQTTLNLLSHDESIEELARLLGGTQITTATLEHAKEMKDMANRAKEY